MDNKLKCKEPIGEGFIIRIKDSKGDYHVFQCEKCEKLDSGEYEVTLNKYEF